MNTLTLFGSISPYIVNPDWNMIVRNKKGRRTNNPRRLPLNKRRSQPVYQSHAYGAGASVNITNVASDESENAPYDHEKLEEVK